LVLSGLVLLAAGAGWLARPWIYDAVARRVETLIALAGLSPARIERLEIDLLPPRARVARILLGSEEAPFADIREVEADLSLARWSLSARAASVRIDVAQVPDTSGGATPVALRLPAWLPFARVQVDALSLALPASEVEASGLVATIEPRVTVARVALEAARLAVDRDGQRLEFAAPTAEVVAAPDRLELRRAELRADGFSLLAEPADGGGSNVALALELARLARFLGSADVVEGGLAWQGVLKVPSGTPSLQALELDGLLRVDSPVWGEVRARSARARLALREGRLVADELDVEFEQGRLHGRVAAGVEPPFGFEARVDADGSDLRPLVDLLGDSWAGALSATLEAQGDLRPLSLTGTASATLRGLRRAEVSRDLARQEPLDGTVAAQFGVTPDSWRAEGRLALAPPAPAAEVATAEFRAALDRAGGLSGGAELSVPDARGLRALLPALTGGRARGVLAITGTVDAPEIRGEIAAEQIDLASTRFDRVGGAFELTRDSLVAKKVEFRALGGQATLDGRIALAETATNDWRLLIEHLELAAVWVALDAAGVGLPYITGTVDAQAGGVGAWQAIELAAYARTGTISIGPERLSGVSLEVASGAGGWKLDGQVARRADEVLQIAGGGRGLEPMWLSAWSTPWPVSGFRFLGDLPQPRGSAVLSADLYGRLDDLRGYLQLTLEDLGIGARDLGAFNVRADLLANRVVALDLRDDSERLRLEGRIERAGSQPFSARLDLGDFDLAHFLAPAQPLVMMSRGTGRLEGRLADLSRSFTGELRLDRFSLGRDDLRLEAVRPIEIRARGGRVEVVSFDLGGTYGTVVVGGTAELSGALALTVRLDADATVAEAFPRSPVKWAAGRAMLEMGIRRPAGGALDLTGEGRLERVSVDLGLPFLITEANGEFSLRGSRIVLEPIRGRAGGGQFALGGYVDVEEGLVLSWEATEVNSGFLEWIEDQVSGRGEIRGPFDALEISGDIAIVNAIYDRDLELTDLLPVFRRELGPAPPEPGEKPIALALRIRAPDSIYVDNNIARAEFAADLQIGGSDLDPRIKGEVELLDGEVTIFDRRFEITLGRVGFGGGAKVNPTLEFSANADVSTPEGEFNIIAEVVGTLDDPRVKLSADDSSLSTNDVVTLLTVGKTMAQLQSEGGGVSAADLSKLAPMLYGAQVEKQVTRYLPIDRFSLEPGFSRTTGDFEPKITVGTEISRGLRGTLSTTLAAQNQNSVQLEYQLTPSALVVASWVSRTETREGGFGGALKFRHRFRYLPFTLLPSEWRRRE